MPRITRNRLGCSRCPVLAGVERDTLGTNKDPLGSVDSESGPQSITASRSASGFTLGSVGIDIVAELHNVGKPDWVMGQPSPDPSTVRSVLALGVARCASRVQIALCGFCDHVAQHG
jgi:hypothetical protein